MNISSVNSGKVKSAPFVFEWARGTSDSYVLTPDRKRIRRIDGPMRTYTPDDETPPIQRVFSDISVLNGGVDDPDMRLDDADWCLAFAKRYGFIGSPDWGANAREEPVDWIVAQRGYMSAFLAFFTGPQASPPTPEHNFNSFIKFNEQVTPHMTVRLDLNSGGVYQLVVVPRSLLAWMWLQIGFELAGEISAKKCKRNACAEIFYVGKRKATKRREYCSDNCRVMDHYSSAANSKKGKRP